MKMTDQDVYEIATFIVNNIKVFLFDYRMSDGILPFEDFVQSRVHDDLSYKFNKYQMEEIFSDPRICKIFSVIYNKGKNNDTKIKIH